MNKKVDLKMFICFIVGLVTYLVGLFLLFWSGLSKNNVIHFIDLTNNVITKMKIIGIVLFVIGFILFMFAVVSMYKKDKIVESNRDLIIEGKADVITIIIMTYIMIVMLVLCLLFDQIIGALLFGVVILVQSVVNNVLIKYFDRKA